MPAVGPQNTRARQRRRSRPQPRPMVPHGPGGTMLRPAPRHRYIPPSARNRNRYRPTRQQINQSRAQARQYRSQGQAVERAANRQRRAAQRRQVRRRALAQERSYRSQGQAVERAANRANVQSRRARLRPGLSLSAIEHFLTGPVRAQSPRGRLTGRGLPGGTVTPGCSGRARARTGSAWTR
jgi:hypothetical protein